MYKAFPYEKTSVRTKLYKCFYVFISYRERISFISDAAPRRLTSKCACGRVLFKSQLLTLGYFCFGYRPVGSYIFFGNRSRFSQKIRLFRRIFCVFYSAFAVWTIAAPRRFKGQKSGGSMSEDSRRNRQIHNLSLI